VNRLFGITFCSGKHVHSIRTQSQGRGTERRATQMTISEQGDRQPQQAHGVTMMMERKRARSEQYSSWQEIGRRKRKGRTHGCGGREGDLAQRHAANRPTVCQNESDNGAAGASIRISKRAAQR
jgi:hypothetical protein